MAYIVAAGTSGFDNNLNISSDQPDLNTNNNGTQVSIAVSDFTVSPAATSLAVKRGAQANEVLTFLRRVDSLGRLRSRAPSAAFAHAHMRHLARIRHSRTNATLTVNAAALSAH